MTTRRMATVDGCPECVVNYETPVAVEDLRGGYKAAFWCHRCDHRWYTSYSDEDEG